MGTYQNTEYEITIPDVERTAAALERFMGGNVARNYGWTRLRHDDELAGDYVLDMLHIALGQDADVSISGDYPALKSIGTTSGKVSALESNVLGILASTGATGVIDWDCEGERGRYRLRGGKVLAFEAVLTYPEDPGE